MLKLRKMKSVRYLVAHLEGNVMCHLIVRQIAIKKDIPLDNVSGGELIGDLLACANIYVERIVVFGFELLNIM